MLWDEVEFRNLQDEVGFRMLWDEVETICGHSNLGGVAGGRYHVVVGYKVEVIVKENAEPLLRSSSIVDNFRVLPWILSLTAVVSTTLPSPA